MTFLVAHLEQTGTADGIYSCEIRLSSEIFSWDVIKRAAYRLSGRCSFDFKSDGNEIICKLVFPRPQPPEIVAATEVAFRNEILDQDLRARIAEETAPIRNALLAFAFSKTGIQGPR